jgi:hypothetical protein
MVVFSFGAVVVTTTDLPWPPGLKSPAQDFAEPSAHYHELLSWIERIRTRPGIERFVKLSEGREPPRIRDGLGNLMKLEIQHDQR